MPFTISHAAAVLPFLRTRLNFSALVIGAMSPDFEYILMWKFSKTIAHSPLGLFVFCIPVGLLFFYLYHRLWKRIIIDCLPTPWRRRIMYTMVHREHNDADDRWYYIVPAILIGAITHQVLDVFSHSYGWGANLLPLLKEPSPWLGLYYWHFSFGLMSLAGLAALYFAIRRWYVRTPELEHCPPRRIRLPWFAVIGIAVGGIDFIWFFAWLRHHANTTGLQTIAHTLLGAMIFITLALTLIGLGANLWLRRKD